MNLMIHQKIYLIIFMIKNQEIINLLMKHYKDKDIQDFLCNSYMNMWHLYYESTNNIVHKRQNEQIKYFLTHGFQNHETIQINMEILHWKD